MEGIINEIERYRNRQVIFNYYQDEDFLWKRDGFEFISIKIANDVLIFTKKDEEVLTISIKEFPNRTKSGDFQNFYFFRGKNLSDRLEMYFP